MARRAGKLTLAPALLPLALAACGASDRDAAPGEVTVGEAKALSEAAEMLDEQRLPSAAPSAAPSEAASEAATR